MKIFVYQGRKQVGPFSLQEIRQRLLIGEFRPTHLAWHNRLPVWVPLGSLANVALIDVELAAPPDPEASPHFTASSSSESRRRVRHERSGEGRENTATSDTVNNPKPSVAVEPQESKESKPAPAANAKPARERSRRSESQRESKSHETDERERRVRRKRTSFSSRPIKESKSIEINVWQLIKDFFRN